MLRNTPVYNITSNIALAPNLCPFVETVDAKKAFETWRKHRAYLRTNRTAERVVAQLGGENTREAKRRLSLSDCYWIKYPCDFDVKFEDITPYSNSFSIMDVHQGVSPSSVPELVLGGSQPKQWGQGQDDITYMSKAEQSMQIHTEILAVKLAHASGLKAMNAFVRTESGKVYAKNYPTSFDYNALGVINIVNITNPSRSMIQLDQLGLTPNGYNPLSVNQAYMDAGVKDDVLKIALTQILFDTVIGNIDRKSNSGNWAVFMDNASGRRSPSWLYDFNWGNLITQPTDMIEEVSQHILGAKLSDIAQTLLAPISKACSMLGLTLWGKNAQTLEARLSSFTKSKTWGDVYGNINVYGHTSVPR